ncbi:hypothetical protein MMC19_003976 [Ptychographa xylographoides]|nr:hypothetical protein [Ptychographa xylographoides]
MADPHYTRERRSALIPESACLSAKESEDVLRRRTGNVSASTLANRDQPVLLNPFVPRPAIRGNNDRQQGALHDRQPVTRKRHQTTPEIDLDSLSKSTPGLLSRRKPRHLSGRGHVPSHLQLENTMVHHSCTDVDHNPYSAEAGQIVTVIGEVSPRTTFTISDGGPPFWHRVAHTPRLNEE